MRLARTMFLLGAGMVVGALVLASHLITLNQLLGGLLWCVCAYVCVRTLIRLLRT